MTTYIKQVNGKAVAETTNGHDACRWARQRGRAHTVRRSDTGAVYVQVAGGWTWQHSIPRYED